MGRKKKIFENINNQGEVQLSSISYTETGQLLSKGLHNNMQSTNYTYNERGWLKYGSSNQFTFLMRYEDANLPQWNGNISEVLWGASNPMGNTFTYTYDKLNRLLSGSAGGMSEIITYDEMGNIKTMNRDGQTGVYNYDGNGNRLHQITGGTLATQVYSYDANGNTIYDGRIQKTTGYNILNLPQTVSGGISYTYDATGRKLKKQSATTTHYVNGVQYTGGTIDFLQTEEGRALNMGGTYKYEYDLKDHLGNVRYSFDIYNGGVRKLQEDNYYPFGKRKMPNTMGNPDNKYLYNGKEFQEELGQYDYGMRFYDPVVGRWNVVDPLAEKFFSESPFSYAGNNPALNIDPDGMAYIPGGGEYGGDLYSGEEMVELLTQEKNKQQGSSGDIGKVGVGGSQYARNQRMAANKGGAVIKAYEPDVFDQWCDSDNFLAKASYSIVDGVYVFGQSFINGPDSRHLNGESVSGNDRVNAFVSTSTLALPIKLPALILVVDSLILMEDMASKLEDLIYYIEILV